MYAATIGYGGSATRHERNEEGRIYGKIAILGFSRGQRKKTHAATRSSTACAVTRAQQLSCSLRSAERHECNTRHHHHAFVSREEALLDDSSRAARKQRGKPKPKCSTGVSWLLGRTPLRSVSVLCLHKAALTARQQKAFFPSENHLKNRRLPHQNTMAGDRCQCAFSSKTL